MTWEEAWDRARAECPESSYRDTGKRAHELLRPIHGSELAAMLGVTTRRAHAIIKSLGHTGSIPYAMALDFMALDRGSGRPRKIKG